MTFGNVLARKKISDFRFQIPNSNLQEFFALKNFCYRPDLERAKTTLTLESGIWNLESGIWNFES